MTYGYIRVSTDMQTVENQKLAITEYCDKYNYQNIVWYSETISGTKSINKRELGKLLNTAQSGDTIIITAISRFGRNMIMILDICQKFIDKKVKVIVIKEGFTIEDNLNTKVLLFAFGLSAELERTLLSERTQLGLERARHEGKQIGRKVGFKPSNYKLTKYHDNIIQWRSEKKSISYIARQCNVDDSTVKAYMIRFNIQ